MTKRQNKCVHYTKSYSNKNIIAWNRLKLNLTLCFDLVSFTVCFELFLRTIVTALYTACVNAVTRNSFKFTARNSLLLTVLTWTVHGENSLKDPNKHTTSTLNSFISVSFNTKTFTFREHTNSLFNCISEDKNSLPIARPPKGMEMYKMKFLLLKSSI